MFKHLGQAAVWTYATAPWAGDPVVRALTHMGRVRILEVETNLGYPEHCGLVVGHLACAAEEILARSPEVAQQLRRERLKWSPYLYGGDKYPLPIEEMIHAVSRLGVEGAEERWNGDVFIHMRTAMVLGHLAEAAEEGMEASPTIAPRILTYLQEWQEGIVSGTEPELVYEGLFDSLIHTMMEEGEETLNPAGLEGFGQVEDEI